MKMVHFASYRIDNTQSYSVLGTTPSPVQELSLSPPWLDDGKHNLSRVW